MNASRKVGVHDAALLDGRFQDSSQAWRVREVCVDQLHEPDPVLSETIAQDGLRIGGGPAELEDLPGAPVVDGDQCKLRGLSTHGSRGVL
jgi:hypothetical protein